MSDEQLETKVLKEVDIAFIVVGKRIKRGLLGEKCLVSCYSDQLGAGFRLKVDEPTYHMLEDGGQYSLKNQPVLQQYDKDGNQVGEPFVRPSNLLFG